VIGDWGEVGCGQVIGNTSRLLITFHLSGATGDVGVLGASGVLIGYPLLAIGYFTV
jgi:hypothetical protein